MINQPSHLPHQLTENVKLLHKVAIVHDGKVLIVKRASDSKSRPDCWDLPGGNSEWPSTVTQPTRDLHKRDVAREIQEETGLAVNAETFTVNNLCYFSSFFEPEKQIYTVICGWKVTQLTEPVAERVVLSSEHTEYTWIGRADLSTYDFGGVKGEFITKIIEAAFLD